MLERAFRAAKLDVELYELVERDTTYTREAFLIVVIANGLAALGGAVFGDGNLIPDLVVGILLALVGWVIWAFVTLGVGTKVFDGTADLGEMLRVLGFAQAPLALGIIPVLGAFVGAVWTLVASVVAIRQGLDFTTGRAIGTVLVGWLALVLVTFFVGALIGG